MAKRETELRDMKQKQLTGDQLWVDPKWQKECAKEVIGKVMEEINKYIKNSTPRIPLLVINLGSNPKHITDAKKLVETLTKLNDALDDETSEMTGLGTLTLAKAELKGIKTKLVQEKTEGAYFQVIKREHSRVSAIATEMGHQVADAAAARAKLQPRLIGGATPTSGQGPQGAATPSATAAATTSPMSSS